MLEFAKANPGWALMMVMTVCGAVVMIASYVLEAYRLRLRARNIAAQGWPSNPEMDADGNLKSLSEKPEYWRDLDKRCLDELALEKGQVRS